MNYLAHLYLSGNSEDLMVGNFIADSIKGSDVKNFSQKIQEGIFLHRAIDSFTDKHAIVKQSKQRLLPYYHKYSTVIVDVFYDHFLASGWGKYSEVPLRDYCNRVYELLEANKALMPAKARQFLSYASYTDIFFRYSTIEGTANALSGLSHRATFKSGMHLAHHDLLKDYDFYKNEFTLFFEDLKKELWPAI